MEQQEDTAGVITPAQMAYLRAKLYAQRGVTNREAALLLEAYDDLLRRFTSTAEEPSPIRRAFPSVQTVATGSMQPR